MTSLGFGYGGYFYSLTTKGIVQNTKDLENIILRLENKNIILAKKLQKEKHKNEVFGNQIGKIVGTVGILDKLVKIDKELLQKYSKVYFLNENYVPKELTNIPIDYLYEKDRKLEINAKVFPYLQSLLVVAKENNIDLKIISAYRSFGEQTVLKSGYKVVYGNGSNKFSADQGYSEHQLGTTIDFTTSKTGATFGKFKNTKGFNWLKENAYKYGFILSYPNNNAYYQYEPWHWRFVGKSLARRLHEEKQYFYDMNQRTIDNYLINIFD